jgi:PadR family transcriptional regulator PadR
MRLLSASTRPPATSCAWLRAAWDTTHTGRQARFYTLTPAGRRQLDEEERRWLSLTEAVGRALRLA